MCTEGRRAVVETVADGAALDIDVSAGGEVCGVRLHMGADHFALDTGIERHVDQLALVREGGIVDCDGHSAVHEVHEYGERDENESDNQSDNEAHKVC
jgi:hypothetical protein